MAERNPWMTVAATLLYLGPLLAGLSRAPATVLPVFAGLFLVWVAATRAPAPAGVAHPAAPVPVVLHLGGVTLVQSLLVIVTFGLGRGLSGLLGGSLSLPLWLPLALSAVAIPLVVAFRSAVARSTDDEALLDEACTELEAAGHIY